jgi:hypothetical protein
MSCKGGGKVVERSKNSGHRKGSGKNTFPGHFQDNLEMSFFYATTGKVV